MQDWFSMGGEPIGFARANLYWEERSGRKLACKTAPLLPVYKTNPSALNPLHDGTPNL
jgi:hypothetical protein